MAAKIKLANLILRLGLAAVFLYAAVSSLVSPNDWVGYLPAFTANIVPAGVLLKIFSAYELLLALWLVSGKYTRYAGALSALTLLGIILSDIKLLAITFRDLAVAAAAAALTVLAD